MQTSTNLKLKRLQKQQQNLIKEPIANVLVKRDGMLDFHFVIYNLEGEYKDGFYHGLLQLHENYPFAAPKLFFYTPSGRFDLNMPICTSFTNYHQESWTSAWNVRSLILGTISFMTSNQASYGCRSDSEEVRRTYAKRSMIFNMKNPKFVQLFLDQLKAINPPIPQVQQHLVHLNRPANPPLQNEQELVLLPPSNQPQQQRNQKCRKIILACGIILPIVGLLCYVIFK